MSDRKPKAGDTFVEVIDDEDENEMVVGEVIEDYEDGTFLIEDEDGDEWTITYDVDEGGWFVTDA